jgi:hypothetical protein
MSELTQEQYIEMLHKQLEVAKAALARIEAACEVGNGDISDIAAEALGEMEGFKQ